LPTARKIDTEILKKIFYFGEGCMWEKCVFFKRGSEDMEWKGLARKKVRWGFYVHCNELPVSISGGKLLEYTINYCCK
jgi:hypothetical protein